MRTTTSLPSTPKARTAVPPKVPDRRDCPRREDEQIVATELVVASVRLQTGGEDRAKDHATTPQRRPAGEPRQEEGAE